MLAYLDALFSNIGECDPARFVYERDEWRSGFLAKSLDQRKRLQKNFAHFLSAQIIGCAKNEGPHFGRPQGLDCVRPATEVFVCREHNPAVSACLGEPNFIFRIWQ